MLRARLTIGHVNEQADPTRNLRLLFSPRVKSRHTALATTSFETHSSTLLTPAPAPAPTRYPTPRVYTPSVRPHTNYRQ